MLRAVQSLNIRWRVALALAGLAVALVAAACLAYAFWPSDTVVEQYQPPATLFAPPQSLVLPEAPA
jgi:hypothetical protein